MLWFLDAQTLCERRMRCVRCVRLCVFFVVDCATTPTHDEYGYVHQHHTSTTHQHHNRTNHQSSPHTIATHRYIITIAPPVPHTSGNTPVHTTSQYHTPVAHTNTMHQHHTSTTHQRQPSSITTPSPHHRHTGTTHYSTTH